MLDKAGVTVDELNNATWNPDDGGTFAQLIAKLTLDENGKNALDPAFDKTKVTQYGLIINGAGEGYGQTEWSWLADTTGWRHIDDLYATAYHYDDPRFIKTIQWFADMMAARQDHAAGAGHQPGRRGGLQSRQGRAALPTARG